MSAEPTQHAARNRILAVVLVLMATAVSVTAGFWQFGRFEDRRAEAATVSANYDAAPQPLSDALPSPDATLDATQDWTPVEMTGEYCTDPECVLYVRNRPLGGLVGFWQLVPLTTETGTLLVARGWVESDDVESVPAEQPDIPEGTVTVTARLRPAEPLLEDRTNPPGQVHSVTPGPIAAQLPDDLPPVYTDAYGDLAAEEPATAEQPTPLEEPDTGLGPHLSYAVQWWVLAAFFPIALVVRSVRAHRDARERPAAAAGVADARSTRPREDATDHGAAEHGAAEHDKPGREKPAHDAAEHDEPDHDRANRYRTAPASRYGAKRAPRRRGRDEEEEDALLDERRH